MEVLRQLDLAIADGEFLVLVGPSGCGKSTLLRLLAGLEAPSGGDIFVGDRCVTGLRPAQRDVAMVFQSYALYPHLSVADNIGFGLRRQRRRSPVQQLADGLHRASAGLPGPLRFRSGREERIAQRIAEVASTLELDHLLDRLPKELSGGQKQRVALGRAIARQPAVFLMDEPLSNLDAKLRTGTRAQIVELQRRLGTTTVYVTHDQVEAMTMGHRIAVLNRGQLQQLGTPMELYQWPSNLFVAQFIGSPPMNLLPVLAVGPGQLQLGGRRFLLEGAIRAALEQWQSRGGPDALTGGLRAEHLRLAPHQPQSARRAVPRGKPGQRTAAHLPAAGGGSAGAAAGRPRTAGGTWRNRASGGGGQRLAFVRQRRRGLAARTTASRAVARTAAAAAGLS